LFFKEFLAKRYKTKMIEKRPQNQSEPNKVSPIENPGQLPKTEQKKKLENNKEVEAIA